jgi:hypothetical protein
MTSWVRCFCNLMNSVVVGDRTDAIYGGWWGKHVPAAKNTRNNRIIVGRLWLCACRYLSLPGWNSVRTFPLQWRIVEGVVFYAVLAVSKENRRLVLRRTSCIFKTSVAHTQPVLLSVLTERLPSFVTTSVRPFTVLQVFNTSIQFNTGFSRRRSVYFYKGANSRSR